MARENIQDIVRSIDMISPKEYSYIYEDGVLVRSIEYKLEIDTNENITSRDLVNTIRYAYDSEGKLIKKQFDISGGNDKTIYYENKDSAVIAKFDAGGKFITTHSKTDSFGRKEFDEIQLGTGRISRDFSYHFDILGRCSVRRLVMDLLGWEIVLLMVDVLRGNGQKAR